MSEKIDSNLNAAPKKNDEIKVSESGQTDPAKAPYSGSLLPCGLYDDSGMLHRTFEVRELTGYEEDILASKKLSILARLQKIMERCVIRIGPYGQDSKEWSRYILSLPVSDRTFLLREIRIVTLGESLKYNVTCPKCEKKGAYSFNLMDISFSIPEKNQRVWNGTLPRSKKTYLAKVQTGVEEEKLQEYVNGKDIFTAGIWCRMVEFDGKNPVPFTAIKALSTLDREHLRAEFKQYEVQIDTEVEMECRYCGEEFKEEIDMSQASFFFPTAMSRS